MSKLLSKAKNLEDFLKNGGFVRYGNLFAVNDKVFSYDVQIAEVDRDNRTVYLSNKRYSATTTRHQNQIRKTALTLYGPVDTSKFAESWTVTPKEF